MDAKAIRKQVRNVMQEVLPEVMKDVINEAFKKEIREQIETRMKALDSNVERRLEGMNAYCVEQLTKQDKRARDVQGFLMGQVRGHVRTTLAEMDVTIEAMMNVLADSGIVIDNFIDKVNAAKPAVVARRLEEDKAKMEAEIPGQKAESESVNDSAPAQESPSQQAAE